MYKIKLQICLILAISTLFSCGRVNEEDTLWQLKSLPVVFSIISPSHMVKVSLSKTVVKGEIIDTIVYPTARIFVCGEDKNWIELTRQSNELAVYEDVNNELEISEGKSYYLRIDLPESTINAETTVPVKQSEILSAEYIVDKDFPDSLQYYLGTLNAKLKLAENSQCLLQTDDYSIGNENSTFLSVEHLTDRISIKGRTNTFDLHLISLDPYFAKYWAAKEISILKFFYEGDLTAFIGAYNGLLPVYSNIEHGFGLFGSYITSTKTVNITQQ